MYNETWFKVMVWMLSSCYFFLTSAVVIGLLGSPADMEQSHLWMQGMMQAMQVSLMGKTMHLESNGYLGQLVSQTAAMITPAVLSGVILGYLLRTRRKGPHEET